MSYAEELRKEAVKKVLRRSLDHHHAWVNKLENCISKLTDLMRILQDKYPEIFKKYPDSPLHSAFHLPFHTNRLFNRMVESGFRDGILEYFSRPVRKRVPKLGDAIFYYVHYGKGDLDKIEYIAIKSIKRSLKVLTRSTYQMVITLMIAQSLCRDGMLLNEGLLGLSRRKRQWSSIQPNFAIEFPDRTISIFLEGLSTLATLIGAVPFKLRPDFMIYSIQKASKTIFGIDKNMERALLIHPQIIADSKESSDWYKRQSDVNMLIEYSRFFNAPLYVISLEKTKESVCKELQSYEIIVLNEVGFHEGKLSPLISHIKSLASEPLDQNLIALGRLSDEAKLRIKQYKEYAERLVLA